MNDIQKEYVIGFDSGMDFAINEIKNYAKDTDLDLTDLIDYLTDAKKDSK